MAGEGEMERPLSQVATQQEGHTHLRLVRLLIRLLTFSRKPRDLVVGSALMNVPSDMIAYDHGRVKSQELNTLSGC